MEEEYKNCKFVQGHKGVCQVLEMGRGACITREKESEQGKLPIPIRKNLNYIVFEYLPEGDIFDTIATKGPLNRKDLALYFSQILDTVEHLHEELKMAHLDIKLENLLLDKAEVKLCDFGFSESTESEIKKKKGTDNYMAPEVYFSYKTPYKGKTADIFSLGILLFILMYGVPPFVRADDKDHFYRAFVKNFPKVFFKMHPKVKDQFIAGDMDMDLVQLFIGMFERDPEKRIQSVREIRGNKWVSDLLKERNSCS
jgi:serine/threonine protein kinase